MFKMARIAEEEKFDDIPMGIYYKIVNNVASLRNIHTGHDQKNITSNLGSDENSTIYEKLALIHSELSERYTLTPLLMNSPYVDYWDIMENISPDATPKETLRYCSNSGLECQKFKPYTHSHFHRCFEYVISNDKTNNEMFAQGVNNGVTFVFFTGARLAAHALNQSSLWLMPGWEHTFMPSAAVDGVRLVIENPNIVVDPFHRGTDIPPGFSTLIGVTGRQVLKLSSPYSDCVTVDPELLLLHETLARDIPDIAEKLSESKMAKSSYSPIRCRSACLQKIIWSECQCLDPRLQMPVLLPSMLCGAPGKNTTHARMFFNPEQFGREHCFESNGEFLASEECSFLHNIISSLACAKGVKLIHAKQENEHRQTCSCPSQCQSYEYDLSFSHSVWPSPGIETDTAYVKLIKNDLAKQYENMNTTESDKIVGYLLNEDNRNEIMKDFARVTIYNERLSTTQVQQVPAYSGEDLISDIGMEIKLDHQRSWKMFHCTWIFRPLPEGGGLFSSVQVSCSCRSR